RRERTGVAAEVLAARGVKIEAVREAIVNLLSHGEQPEPPGPPGTPANTYKWPWIPFVPSRMVHILHSGAQWPTPPVINFTGTHFSAFGFTVEDIIVRAWEGNRWHVEIPPALRTGARFDTGPVRNRGCGRPCVDGALHPRWNRNRSHVSAF